MIKLTHPKLTIHLKVLKHLREDGYHNIEILSIPLEEPNNKIIFGKSKGNIICDTGDIKIFSNNLEIPLGEKSLAYKAIKFMKEEYKIKEKIIISIEENIPSSAGLGGGSSTAAGIINGINEFYQLGIDKKELVKKSICLGSDVPLCVLEKPAIVLGKGDIVKEIDLKINYPILLIIPKNRKIEKKTAKVYQTFDKYASKDEIASINEVLENGKIIYEKLGNSFKNVPLYKVLPYEQYFKAIDEISKIKGVKCVNFAGAGPTLFCILEETNILEEIKNKINYDSYLILTKQKQ